MKLTTLAAFASGIISFANCVLLDDAVDTFAADYQSLAQTTSEARISTGLDAEPKSPKKVKVKLLKVKQTKLGSKEKQMMVEAPAPAPLVLPPACPPTAAPAPLELPPPCLHFKPPTI